MSVAKKKCTNAEVGTTVSRAVGGQQSGRRQRVSHLLELCEVDLIVAILVEVIDQLDDRLVLLHTLADLNQTEGRSMRGTDGGPP